MAGVFNPVGVQAQQGASEKTSQSAEGMDAAAELTLQGEAMLMCSCIKETYRFFTYGHILCVCFYLRL